MQRKDLQAAYLQIIGIACDGANYFACQGVCCTLMFLIVLYVTVRHNFALHFTLPYNTCIYTDLAPKLVATTSVAQSVERMSFGEPEIERSISTWRRP